ncbi:MAG: hypothetical protein CM15mP127_12300 [Gammaproteobacteria bacterium]|nr:MAG: hypothetical protein CM15mP127_12300 [Gammaproteobacteria bacterium]
MRSFVNDGVRSSLVINSFGNCFANILLTPPFGFSLFYLRGVAGDNIQTKEIYKGVVPFIVIQLVALALVILFPWILIL